MELDPQVSPEEIMTQGGGAGLRKLDVFRFGLFLNSSATDIVLVTLPSTAVETAIARCTSRWAMARGQITALTLPLFWRRSTVSSVFFRAVTAVEPSFFLPPPPLRSLPRSPTLISHLASVDVKQNGRSRRILFFYPGRTCLVFSLRGCLGAKTWCLTSTETMRLIRDEEKGGRGYGVGEEGDCIPIATLSPPE